MSESDEDDTPLEALLDLAPTVHFGMPVSESSMSISAVALNEGVAPETQLIEAFTKAFGKLRDASRECASVYPDEVHRLLVFGPRLLPFAHRDVCSIRHPRTSCVAWKKKIAFGTANATRVERLSALDSMNTELTSERDKWRELAAIFEAISTKVVAAQVARDQLMDDVAVERAIGRLWSRATGTLPSDGIFMNQQQYCLFETRLYSQLYDSQSLLDALDPIEKDYIYDSMITKQAGHHREGVSFEAFTSSMLELADNWTATGSAAEYAALLYDILVQIFAPQWSADADPAFQVFLSKKTTLPRATVTANAAEARRGHRLYLASSDAEDAKSVMEATAQQTQEAVAKLLNSVVPAAVASRPLNPRPPKAPKAGAKATPAQVDRATAKMLVPSKPQMPLTVESLADTDQYYPHREMALTREERQLRAQIRLKLKRATASPLYVAVRSKVLAISGRNESEAAVTERMSQEHFGSRALAVRTARWRITSSSRPPLALLPLPGK